MRVSVRMIRNKTKANAEESYAAPVTRRALLRPRRRSPNASSARRSGRFCSPPRSASVSCRPPLSPQSGGCFSTCEPIVRSTALSLGRIGMRDRRQRAVELERRVQKRPARTDGSPSQRTQGRSAPHRLLAARLPPASCSSPCFAAAISVSDRRWSAWSSASPR